jgi:hypothetical protein
MSIRATVLGVDGTSTVELFADEPPLVWLQARVRGYIEVVMISGRRVVVNEDAIMTGLPINELAAQTFGRVSVALDGLLRGNVVLLEPSH